MKKKTFYVSIAFHKVNLIIWMDAKSIYLTCRILIYFIILTCLLSFKQKAEFGENKILGRK